MAESRGDGRVKRGMFLASFKLQVFERPLVGDVSPIMVWSRLGLLKHRKKPAMAYSRSTIRSFACLMNEKRLISESMLKAEQLIAYQNDPLPEGTYLGLSY